MNRKCHSLMPLFRGVRLCPDDIDTLRISYSKVFFLKKGFVQSDLSFPLCFSPFDLVLFLLRGGAYKEQFFF